MPLPTRDTTHFFDQAVQFFENGLNTEATERFASCVAEGGLPEEVWYSMYSIARIRHASGQADPRSIVQGYAEAYDFCPARLEPVAHLAKLYREAGDHQTAYELSRLIFETPRPEVGLFLEPLVYDLLLPLEFIQACRALGRADESEKLVRRLLRGKDLPQDIRNLIRGSTEPEYLTFVDPAWWESS